VARFDKWVGGLLKKWKEGVRSKFSENDLRRSDVKLPKIGPDPGFFSRLPGAYSAPGR